MKWPWSKPAGGIFQVDPEVARCPRRYRWLVVLRGGHVACLCDECATRLGDKLETMTFRPPRMPGIISPLALRLWERDSRCQAAAGEPGDSKP